MSEQTTENPELEVVRDQDDNEVAEAAENISIEKAAKVEVDAQENVEEKLQADLADAKNKYAYLVAELDNTQKRFQREKENLLKFGSERIIKQMLEVADNFERTIQAISNDEDEKIKNIVVGIEMVNKQLIDGLKKFGLEEVQSLGNIFDPNFHEAVAQESVEEIEDEEITKEYQKGYKLNGRLLRASKVVVNKK
jgi:molecular chaperone GrpE